MTSHRLWRLACQFLLIKPVSLFWLGFNIRRKQLLPATGPAIIVANHNSHLDVIALLSLVPAKVAPRVRPAAASDYFMRTPVRRWLSTRLLGAVPVERTGEYVGDPLAPCQAVLDEGDILILFPEGTRGEPERMQELKSGIAHLAKNNPTVPVIPVYMAGLGKAMPRGAWLPIPVFVDVYVGPAMIGCQDKAVYMQQLGDQFKALATEHGRFSYIDDETDPHNV